MKNKLRAISFSLMFSTTFNINALSWDSILNIALGSFTAGTFGTAYLGDKLLPEPQSFGLVLARQLGILMGSLIVGTGIGVTVGEYLAYKEHGERANEPMDKPKVILNKNNKKIPWYKVNKAWHKDVEFDGLDYNEKNKLKVPIVEKK